jgi:hypothetical protein
LPFGATAVGYHGQQPNKKGPDMAPDKEYEQVKKAVALATELYDNEAALYLASALRSVCSEKQFEALLAHLEIAVAQ